MTNQEKIDYIKNDFKVALYLTWEFLNLPEPTAAQYEMADYLQNKDINRRMIQAYRGIGKSWITSVYVLWRLLNNRELKFLVVSASKSRADDFANFTKKLVNEMSLFKTLKPKAGQRDSSIQFDVGGCKPAHAPSVKSVGINGQLAGTRADEIIADDVEVVNNSQTQEMRESLKQKTTEFSSIIVPGGTITYLGTPQTQESIYRNLKERGFKVRIWTAYYPELNKIDNYNGDLAPSIIKNKDKTEIWNGMIVTDPGRFTRNILEEKRLDMGNSNFELQFQLNTSLSDMEKFPLKLSDLIVFDSNDKVAPMNLSWTSSKDKIVNDVPMVGFTGDKYLQYSFISEECKEYSSIIMSIDPSGRGADETAYSVVAYLNGFLHILECGGIQGGYEDGTLLKLAKIAKQYSVHEIIVESNFGDGMFNKLFSPLLSRIHPCSLEEVRNNKQKELRIIDTLEPLLNRHKLVVSKRVIKENYKEDSADTNLFYQLTHITKDKGSLKHDDRLDVLAIAVSHFIDNMDIDEVKALKDYEDEKLMEDLYDYMEHVTGINYQDNDDIFYKYN